MFNKGANLRKIFAALYIPKAIEHFFERIAKHPYNFHKEKR
jgi:hypothetical protein